MNHLVQTSSSRVGSAGQQCRYLSSAADGIIEKIRRAFLFRPDDPADLLQVLPARHKQPGVERIKGFRYPSPGSQPQAKVPIRTEDELYNTSIYHKDPRNLPDETQILINSAKRPTIIAPGSKPKVGSPGLNFAMQGDSEIDPLRFTTKTTFAARDASLLVHAKPNHNVRYAWENEMPSFLAECEKKGLPAPVGKKYKFKSTPVGYNQISW